MRRYALACTCILTSTVMLWGCASISSSPATDQTDGLVYFLPKKNVLVTVIKKVDVNTKFISTTVEIASTAAFPDLSQPYAINFNRNLVGKNALKVGISSTGLLSSSKATSTGGLTDALKNLVESVGMLSGSGLGALPDPVAACGEGTHSFIYTVEPGQKPDACDQKISIERFAAASSAVSGTPLITSAATPSQGSRSGVFYRQEEAFKVTARGPNVNASTIVLSPSLAPTRFLPVSGSLFSSNEADFGFIDGMPTKYDQEADGELIALFKLPADVIGAYFGAVGRLFDNFKARDTKVAEVLTAETKAELAKKKYDACLDAIKSKNDALILQLECGK